MNAEDWKQKYQITLTVDNPLAIKLFCWPGITNIKDISLVGVAKGICNT